jgi:hypothetical protein
MMRPPGPITVSCALLVAALAGEYPIAPVPEVMKRRTTARMRALSTCMSNGFVR